MKTLPTAKCLGWTVVVLHAKVLRFELHPCVGPQCQLHPGKAWPEGPGIALSPQRGVSHVQAFLPAVTARRSEGGPWGLFPSSDTNQVSLSDPFCAA